MRIISVLFSSALIATNAAAQDARVKAINDAISAAERVCLSGSRFEFQAKADGSLSITKFLPGGNVTVTVDQTTARGAQFIESPEMKRVIDEDIRPCMQTEWPHILKAYDDANIPPVGKPTSVVFHHPDYTTLDGEGATSGHMTNIEVSIVDYKDAKPATFVAGWTWTGGGGGSQEGSQTVIIDLISDTGATVQTLSFPLDRSHCYYGGNNQRFPLNGPGNLQVPASLITKISVSVSRVVGRQGRC